MVVAPEQTPLRLVSNAEKFCGTVCVGRDVVATAFLGLGCCNSTISTRMAFSGPAAVAAARGFTLNRRDRVVRSGLYKQSGSGTLHNPPAVQSASELHVF